MFKRRTILLISTFIIALGVLIWNWSEVPGISLETATRSASTQRLALDLQGYWNSYPSLRQAYASEIKQIGQGNQPKAHLLMGADSLDLPSTQKFHVVVKHFQIPSEWSARKVLFLLKGVYGEGAVYLNGIDSAHQIGKFANDGGTEEFLLPENVINYGEDNILLIESSAPSTQGNTLFGLDWPAKGQIKGSLELTATMETSLSVPKVSVEWSNEDAVVSVHTRLTHHSVTEYGPWEIQGIFSDGSAAVATASTQVKPADSSVQDVTLTFKVPHARQWTTTDPFSYQLYLTVMNPKGDKDDLAIPLGLSTITMQGETFIQKGQPLTISGITLSPEQEAKVRHADEIEEWLMSQKDSGYNLIYFIGSFPDEAWLTAADQLGMGVWAELPAKMIPANRLPDPSIWANLVQEGTLHPSLWAWTVGTGLEVDPRAQTSEFVKSADGLTQPLPTFQALLTKTSDSASTNNIQLTKTGFEGSWGKVDYDTEAQTATTVSWPKGNYLEVIWAVWVIIVILANLSAVNWRYKEIKEPKPKRALRRAYHWQSVALLSRYGTLAGIVVSLIFQIQVPWADWIPEQWPLWTALKQQSPLLIWFILTLIFVFLRLLQAGVAAPHLPEKPTTFGLALWLERRYRWIWIPALLWAARPWGIPFYMPLAVYIGLTLLYFPIRVRDVHKVKGKYRPIMLVPSIFFFIFLAVTVWRWSDGYYLYYLVKALRG